MFKATKLISMLLLVLVYSGAASAQEPAAKQAAGLQDPLVLRRRSRFIGISPIHVFG